MRVRLNRLRISHSSGEVYQSSSPAGMRVSGTEKTMSSASFNVRPDDKIATNEDDQRTQTSRAPLQYETTTDGDVVVVEPSFDADDTDARSPASRQQTFPETETRSPPTKASGEAKRGHSRNLSEHFYDATTLTNERKGEMSVPSDAYGARAPPPANSPATGRKHRRGFSGDVSNPPEAHRRINSSGNSTSVRRRSHGQERRHQRVDSAGLDILTAAADVSREELSAAAGRGAHPWDSTSSVPSRRSPTAAVTYDQTGGLPPPPPPPPPPQHRHHPHHYGPPPPGPPPHGHPYYGPPLAYQQSQYPPHYYHPGYQRPVPTTSGYPVQYGSRGPDPYRNHPSHPSSLHQSTLQRPIQEVSAPRSSAISHVASKNSPETLPHHAKTAMSPPPPSHWQGGTTQGVQTFVTTIGVGEGGRTVHPNLPHRRSPTNTETGEPSAVATAHHRKSPSLGWVPPPFLMGQGGDPGLEHPSKAHHRSTSSSISFLQGLDVGLESDATFLKNLQASTGIPAPAFNGYHGNFEGAMATMSDSQNSDKSKLALGGTSKRVRRKCTIDGCANRVVQGGLCIAHGAKRKQCKHPGCTKNVKKAGLCSTHGPARKRCEAEGCSKVAVQGGRCIAHGAKKKLCSVDGCAKQAILSGMCKKHHDKDRSSGRGGPLLGESYPSCKVIENAQPSSDSQEPLKPSKGIPKPTHTRGLSIFQEISAVDVGNLLTPENEGETGNQKDAPGHRHRSTFSREFANLY